MNPVHLARRLVPVRRDGDGRGRGQRPVHLVIGERRLDGDGQGRRRRPARLHDCATGERERVRSPGDAVGVGVVRHDLVGKHQRPGARAPLVGRRRCRAAKVEGEGRRAGHRHRLVERDRELDVLPRPVGVHRQPRRRGHRDPRHSELVVDDGDGVGLGQTAHRAVRAWALEVNRWRGAKARGQDQFQRLVRLRFGVVHRGEGHVRPADLHVAGVGVGAARRGREIGGC